ncbi:MAG: hypothetical protein BA863_06160 [Desulfovibrio sp. S3730MH75]|nr:MAG: hypothetical protein BA863_06160 [Desulfovibrio sp. S3730MH75]
MSFVSAFKKTGSRFFLTIICTLFIPYMLDGCATIAQYSVVLGLPLFALLADYMRFVNKVIVNEERPEGISQGSFYVTKLKSSFGLFFNINSEDSLKKSWVNGRVVAWILCGVLGASIPIILKSQTFENLQVLAVSGYYEQKKDYIKDREFVQPFAENGNALAQYQLGFLLHKGLGGPVDNEKAIYWMRLAHEQGYIDGTRGLASLYEHDCVKAVILYEKAIAANDSQSMKNMTNMYLNGKCVEKSLVKAIVLLKKAAALGNKDALLVLGHHYHYGIGVTRNIETAKKIYLKLAEDGFSKGQVNLAALLFDEGGYTNNVEGLKWVRMAVAQDDPNGIDLLRSFKNRNPHFKLK